MQSPFARIFILVFLLFSLVGCSLIGGLFGTIFAVFGDVFNFGMENLPRLLPYLLFFVENDTSSEETIFLAQSTTEGLPATTAIVNYLQMSPGLEMVIAIPAEELTEERKKQLLEKLKNKKVQMLQVNASDLVDGIVPAEQFGKGLAQFKVSFVGPDSCKTVSTASYQPTDTQAQEQLKMLQTLTHNWTPNASIQVATALPKTK